MGAVVGASIEVNRGVREGLLIKYKGVSWEGISPFPAEWYTAPARRDELKEPRRRRLPSSKPSASNKQKRTRRRGRGS